jgi:glycosyltransferase involved in cell wall biosynthesis
MRVSFLLPGINLAGGVKSTFELASRLQARGHDVRIYYSKYKNLFLRSSNLKANVKNLVNPLLGKNTVFDYGTSVEIVQVPVFSDRHVDDADVVIATWWEDVYPMMKLSPSKGRKHHFIRHYEVWGGPTHKVDRMYRFRNRKIVISTWLKELIENKFHQPVSFCPNGIDRERFFFSPKADASDKVTIGTLYGGGYHAWKGGDDAFEVLRRVWEQHGELVEIVIFGDEVEKPLPFPFRSHVRPFGEKIRKIYSDLDIFLFTSHAEGFGNPPLEAMACRTAVVSTRVGGVPDYGTHEETILIAEPRDLDELTRQVSRLTKDEGLRETLARKAEEASKEFTWDRSVEMLEEILRSA